MNRAIVAGDRPKWRLTSLHSTTEDITRTGLRLGRDNDKPMLRKALNNARQLLYDLKDDL